MGSLIGIIELAAVFGLVIAFGIWQLRSLDKLDREDAEREAKEQNER